MFKFGFVALFGRPNVGKSTLLNAILAFKVGIVSAKPQTSWFNVRGIYTDKEAQIVFIDTPGLHESKKLVNKCLLSASLSALKEMDAWLYLMDPDLELLKKDKEWLQVVSGSRKPGICVINKTDLLKPKEVTMLLESVKEKYASFYILPVSCLNSLGIEVLLRKIKVLLPEGRPLYDEDMLSDSPVRFLAGEFIREKLFEVLRCEIPYESSVLITEWLERPKGMIVIDAEIWVNRVSQKAILIGRGGETIKKIGVKARVDIESLIGQKVYLNLHVKCKHNWVKSARLLEQAGFLVKSALKEGKRRVGR